MIKQVELFEAMYESVVVMMESWVNVRQAAREKGMDPDDEASRAREWMEKFKGEK